MIPLLLLLGLAQANPPQKGLEQFVNRDLTKLSQTESDELQRICDVTLPNEQLFRRSGPRPLWIKPYHTGPVQWLFMRGNFVNSVPSVAFMHAASLDEKLRAVTRYDFSIGYRLWLDDSHLVTDPSIGRPVVKLLMRSEGPFHVMDGKPGEPLFEPASGIREWYVFDREAAHLVRIETGDGTLLSNDYTSMVTETTSNDYGSDPITRTFVDIGPSVAGRSAAEWKSDLDSADPVQILVSLTWLAGIHRKPDPSMKEFGQESPEDFKTFQEMRSSPEILKRLKTLANSANVRIRSQATFTLDKIGTT